MSVQWLADFRDQVVHHMSLATLNCIERAVLALINFDVSTSPREYAEAYFFLRDFLPQPTRRIPLDPAQAMDLGVTLARSRSVHYTRRRSASTSACSRSPTATRTVIS